MGEVLDFLKRIAAKLMPSEKVIETEVSHVLSALIHALIDNGTITSEQLRAIASSAADDLLADEVAQLDAEPAPPAAENSAQPDAKPAPPAQLDPNVSAQQPPIAQ